jgi:hypothetical protein
MTKPNTFAFHSKTAIVPMDQQTFPAQESEIRQIIRGQNGIQLLIAGSVAAVNDTQWSFLPSSAKYSMELVGIPKVRTVRVDSVKRYDQP